MKKSTSRNLYLIGIVIAIIGIVVAGIGSSNSNTSTGTSPLYTVGGIAYGIGVLIVIIGYIGTLVKTARLARWGWFICLLLFSGITMLIYIFAGPTEHA